MTRCGILAAMAVILYYIEIPVVAFYKLDLSTLPAILAGFAMGPLPGVAVVVIKNLVHMLGTSTACVGELADIIMSSCFIIPASLIYRRHKDRKSAVLSMAGRHGADDDCGRAGQLLHSDSGVSDADEPAARGHRRHGHEGLELYRQHGEAGRCFITAPFNILKGAVLSVVTYLLYKRVSPLLHQKSVEINEV